MCDKEMLVHLTFEFPEHHNEHGVPVPAIGMSTCFNLEDEERLLELWRKYRGPGVRARLEVEVMQ